MKANVPAIVILLALTCTASAAERTPWTTSRVVGSPDPPKPYHVQRVYPKLQFNQPVELLPLADTGKMMLLEVGGKLYTFDDDPECEQADLAIDLMPLFEPFHRAFGFGIHPNFDRNRQIFIVYAAGPVPRPDGTRLSRFVLDEQSPPRVDPDSEEILMTWHSGGHNGSTVRFDSKGYLYFSAGDGARPFPPDEYDTSQDLSDLRSSICRIDVDRREADRPYAIPSDNPFIDTPNARPEIWAYGFRNPWRFTIVPGTDQVLCGDVGWELWELIFDVRRGSNCGWSIFEGPQPIRDDIQRGPTPIEKPLVSYPHAIGQSVTGGVVYNGSSLNDLRGVYLYGDYVTGLLWGLRTEQDQVAWNPVLAETGLRIITFSQSRRGEVLLVDYDGGIYQLIENPLVGNPSDFPRRLSQTGLYTSTATLEPAPGVLPYKIAATSYQGGAQSDFVIGVPNQDTIKINRRQRSWVYPEGTVLANTISFGSRRVETQMLHFNGIDWQPYSYRWNAEQTDAELVDADGAIVELASSETTSPGHPDRWQIHNRAQCRACHGRQNGGAVGFTFENLHVDDQISQLVNMGILDKHAPHAWNVGQMVDPHDTTASLETRARSYLTANCAHCHRRGGGGTVPMDLEFSVPLADINTIDVPPTQGDFGIKDSKVIKPGDPYRSILYYRLATSGTGHMPKLWTRDNDTAGLMLIHDWIQSMDKERLASDERPIAMSDAYADSSKSLRIFTQLLGEQQNAAQRLSIAKTMVDGGVPTTAPLFERFLPSDMRRKRLGSQIDRGKILAIKGDARSGRERFVSTQLGQCSNCHRVQGSGKSVGPDLDGIGGKRSREQLLESILDPSKSIEPQFVSHVALKDDGTVVTGLKVDETPAVVVLRSADGKDNKILKVEIEAIRIQPQSLMPTGLAAELTAQELADLLEFLCSLK